MKEATTTAEIDWEIKSSVADGASIAISNTKGGKGHELL